MMSKEESSFHENSDINKETESQQTQFDNVSIQNNQPSSDDLGLKLSKKELKRRLRREYWMKIRPERRAKEKERKRKRSAEARLNNIVLGPSRKALKYSTMDKSSCKIRVAIDLSFDDYMPDKALSKCVKQIGHCYSLNRRAKDPMQLHLTSFCGKIKEEMSKHDGYTNWDINFHEESHLNIFKKEEIVYLCSESENVLSSLCDDKVYIIGGIVDHNCHKGLTFKLAKEHNLNHCHLPIGEYLSMSSRKVLTIDHVYEILLSVSEGKSWKDAFLKVLPARKGAVEKLPTSPESSSSENKSVLETSTDDISL